MSVSGLSQAVGTTLAFLPASSFHVELAVVSQLLQV